MSTEKDVNYWNELVEYFANEERANVSYNKLDWEKLKVKEKAARLVAVELVRKERLVELSIALTDPEAVIAPFDGGKALRRKGLAMMLERVANGP